MLTPKPGNKLQVGARDFVVRPFDLVEVGAFMTCVKHGCYLKKVSHYAGLLECAVSKVALQLYGCRSLHKAANAPLSWPA